MERLDQLAKQLLEARRILITTHRAPDGDGIGCQLALRDALATKDRLVTIVTLGEIPLRFRFLPGSHEAHDWDLLSQRARQDLTSAQDLFLVVDTHEWSMLGTLGDVLRHSKIPTFFLDHHPNKGPPLETLHGDPDASSTGEICWHLLRNMQIPLSPVAATCLYTAITYDTNSFKYLRRRAETHRVAADLVERGADTDEIYRHVFASNPLAKVALIGEVARRLHLEEGGAVAWVVIDRDLIGRTQAKPDHFRAAITQLLEIQGVEIAIAFKQRGDNMYKVSLRSKGHFSISTIANGLGGGGHAFASGANVEGTEAQVRERVLRLVKELLETTRPSVQPERAP